MRIAGALCVIACAASTAQAQPPSEGVAIGVVATPALDGFTDFWFMPAVRISASLGSRLAIDLDAGRVFGGTIKFASPLRDSTAAIRAHHFYAGQLRLLTARRRSDGGSTYWLVGVHHMATKRFDRDGNLVGREPAGGGVLGFGSDQVFANRTRVSAEIGISGPDGFRPFLAVGVQYPLRFR
jgi:hypothetical protein